MGVYGNCYAVLRTCHGGYDADCSTDVSNVQWMCLVAMLLAVRWTLDQDSGRSSAALLDLLGRGSSLVLLVVVGD